MDFLLTLKQQRQTLGTQLEAVETLISTYEGAGSTTTYQGARKAPNALPSSDRRTSWTPERRQRFAEAVRARKENERKMLEASRTQANGQAPSPVQTELPHEAEPEEPLKAAAAGVSVPESAPVEEEKHEEHAKHTAPSAKKKR